MKQKPKEYVAPMRQTKTNVAENKKSATPKELEWGKEFDKWFNHGTKLKPRFLLSSDFYNEVKDFISKLLTQQRTEIESQKVKVVWNNVCEQIKQEARAELLEEIKKIVEEQLFWYKGEDYGSITAREALNQVKNLLNKKNETN